MSRLAGIALAALALVGNTASFTGVSAESFLTETFDSSWTDRWVVSDWKKADGTRGEWKHTAGEYYADAEKDAGIQTSQDARFYAISSKLPKPFSNEGKDLVVQYQVKHTQKIDCGGGYIKLLPSTVDQQNFSGDSPYHIMFGPDICGTTTKRVHAIFTYKGKNLLTKKTIPCETDQLSHVYTLIVKPDNTYEVLIDGARKEGGSLYDDWDFLPPKKIKDPSQSKPKDWVDDAQIDDPSDVKPADWDAIPKQIPDPEAEKPADWDDEADGEWEAPTIDNPDYKGEWKPKRIPNPDYKGKWVHPEIDNPEYVEDAALYKYDDIGAVGFELWQVKAGTIFDNIWIGDSVEEAKQFRDETWGASKDAEKKAFDDAEKEKREKEEEERKKAEEARKASEGADDDDEDEEEDEDDEDEEADSKKKHDEL